MCHILANSGGDSPIVHIGLAIIINLNTLVPQKRASSFESLELNWAGDYCG